MPNETATFALQLDEEERAVLTTALQEALHNLREEVYKTENFEVRQALKRRESLLSRLVSRLEQ